MNSGGAGIAGVPSDRRVSDRRSVRLAARCEGDGGISWPCQIVEFSADGVLLRYPSRRRERVMGWHEQGNRQLRLLFRSAGGHEMHRIEVQVVRHYAGILAVRFLDAPLRAFESLLEASGIARAHRYRRPDQRLQQARVAVRMAVVPSLPSLIEPEDLRPAPPGGQSNFTAVRKLWGALLPDAESAATAITPSSRELLRGLRHAETELPQQPLRKRLAAWFDQHEEPLPKAMKDVAGLIEQFMRALGRSPRLTRRGRWCLQRLETTMLATVLSNTGDLESRSHPLRRLIDRIGHLDTVDHCEALDWSPELYHRITRIARGLEGHHYLQTTVDYLGHCLQSGERRYQNNVRRVVKAAEGGEKLSQAEDISDRALDERLLDVEVPRVVLTLVEKGWRDYLALVCLRCGTESAEWADGLSVLDELMAVASGAASVNKSALLARLSLGLEQIGCAESSRLVLDLEGFLEAPHKSHRVRLGSGFHQRAAGSSASADTQERLWASSVEQIRVGSWFLDNGCRDGVRPLRLAWSNRVRNRFILVDPSGRKVAEFSTGELAAALSRHELVPVSRYNQNLTDEALERVLQSLHGSLMTRLQLCPETGLFGERECLREMTTRIAASTDHGSQALIILQSGANGTEAASVRARTAALVRAELSPQAMAAVVDEGLLAVVMPGEGAEAWAKGVTRNLRGALGDDAPLRAGVVHYDSSLVTARQWLDLTVQACRRASWRAVPHVRRGSVPRARVRRIMHLADRLVRDDGMRRQSLLLMAQRLIPLHGQTRMGPQYDVQVHTHGLGGELVGPSELVPLAERYQKAGLLDREVFSQAVSHLSSSDSILNAGDTGVCINLSGHSLNDPELLEFIHRKLGEVRVPLERICFNITGADSITNPDAVAVFMQEVRDLGCRISLGGLGLDPDMARFIRRLPADLVRLDGCVAAMLNRDERNARWLDATVAVAHHLGCEVMVTGVDELDLVNSLRRAGVDYVQGKAVGRAKLLT